MSNNAKFELNAYVCPRCQGAGYVSGQPCDACETIGSWQVIGDQVIVATLPRVVKTGLLFRLAGLLRAIRHLPLKLIFPLWLGLLVTILVESWLHHASLWEGFQNHLWTPWFALSSLPLLFALYWWLGGRYPSDQVTTKIGRQPPLERDKAEQWATWKQTLPKSSIHAADHMLHPNARAALFDIEHHEGRRRGLLDARVVIEGFLKRASIRQAADRLDLSVDQIRRFCRERQTTVERSGEIVVTRQFQAILRQAVVEAIGAGHRWVRVRDLWVAAIACDEDLQTFFAQERIHLDEWRHVMYWLDREDHKNSWWAMFSLENFRRRGHLDSGWSSGWTVTLDKFSTDLTKRARKASYHPTIVREDKVEEMATILARSAKNNVMILGDPGVGKTALIEGLAHRIIAGDVPDTLKNKRLVELNLGSVVSTATDIGRFSQTMEELLGEVAEAGNVILILDNVHALKGIGGQQEGGWDAFALLEASLLRSDYQSVATTTYADYVRFVEHNESFARCFDRMELTEPSYEETVRILEEVVLTFEPKQKVMVTYQAIKAAIQLSQKYIHDRVLPDKAVDLIDEAMVAVRQHHGRRVRAEDVASVVALRTGVPVSDISVDESGKLMQLEQYMHDRLIGQDVAVTEVSNAVRRSRVGLKDANRPVATFLFVGTTGVGKTELAKTLAEAYFGHEKMMIRLDMSEFKEQDGISRLIGSADNPDGGVLVQAVRKKPFSLVLLDEFEKAHTDIHNLFLQVFDEGRLTAANGRTVDFTNSILIATSNAGAKMIQDGMLQGRSVEAIHEDLIQRVLPQVFRPELINRFDRVIVFKPLSETEVGQIAKLMLGKVRSKLKEQEIDFKITAEAVEKIAALGYDPIYGARPLRRVIQHQVEDPIARRILTNELRRGDTVVIRLQDLIDV